IGTILIVDCFGNNTGEAKAVVSGGTSGYSYSWNTSPTQTTEIAKTLSAGTYTLEVTDFNNCQDTESVTITQPTAITLTNAQTNVDCYGNSSGSVVLTASGGTSSYTYKKKGGGSYQSSSTFSGLAVGTYTFAVKDANGCTKHRSATITQPNALILSDSVTRPVCASDQTGSIVLFVSGGTSSYTYRLDSSFQQPISAYSSSASYSNLYEGKYAAEVKDSKGCIDTLQIVISHLDLVKPVPRPYTKLTVYLSATGSVAVSALMADSASSDNCALASRSLSKTSFDCSNIGLNTVNFKVVDVNANRDSINFVVDLKDSTPPTIKVRNFTIYLDSSGNATLLIDSVDQGTSDGCNSFTRVLSKTSFNCSNIGLNTVQLKATDSSGNERSVNIAITVSDKIAPTLVLKSAKLYLDEFGKASLITAYIDNGSYDNCIIDSLLMSDSLFDCSKKGVNTVTITGVDKSNNRTSKTVTVTVYDTLKPVLQLKPHTVYLDTAGKGSLVESNIVALLYDNCGGIQTLSISQTKFTLADTGVQKIIVWAKDSSGNLVGPDTVLVTVVAKDSDGDGIPDFIEGSKDSDGDGVFDYLDLDSDNDGLLDYTENDYQALAIDLDGDGIPNFKDLDSDGDGIFDVYEVDGDDPDKDGIAGLGSPTVNIDGVPMVALSGNGYNEIDTDSDGNPDYLDTDSDNDGISDSIEGTVDTDADGTGDWRDLDSDADGILDSIEGTVDTDADGTGDWRDLDSDADGILDSIEGTVDTDADGTGDWRDLDSDADGILDSIEGTVDTDADGTGDWRDLDSDADGILDSIEGTVDTDADGTGDWHDLDSDADGILDSIEGTVDTDADGTGDWRDLDSDADGILDSIEGTVDTDADGTGDWRDLDSDGDGILDSIEGTVDTDADGTGDWRDLDSDDDEIPDSIELTGDNDNDGIPNYIDPEFFIPEAISPNGDGDNDVLYIRGLKTKSYKDAEILIFNRWGQEVFKSGKGYKNNWGGTSGIGGKYTLYTGNELLPEGIYYLIFTYNGKTLSQNLYIKP
ncbi:MAG: gliding motility-associated C-terminal domain-containing protein, partial [Bacteroidetes bacterium]|nr:gliding motility-associated C-terminal domain-containing protein [Bacteroidota bacterium]